MTASIAECEIRTGSSNLSETGSSLNDSESEDESFIELDADSILSYLDDDNLLIDVDNGELELDGIKFEAILDFDDESENEEEEPETKPRTRANSFRKPPSSEPIVEDKIVKNVVEPVSTSSRSVPKRRGRPPGPSRSKNGVQKMKFKKPKTRETKVKTQSGATIEADEELSKSLSNIDINSHPEVKACLIETMKDVIMVYNRTKKEGFLPVNKTSNVTGEIGIKASSGKGFNVTGILSEVTGMKKVTIARISDKKKPVTPKNSIGGGGQLVRICDGKNQSNQLINIQQIPQSIQIIQQNCVINGQNLVNILPSNIISSQIRPAQNLILPVGSSSTGGKSRRKVEGTIRAKDRSKSKTQKTKTTPTEKEPKKEPTPLPKLNLKELIKELDEKNRKQVNQNTGLRIKLVPKNPNKSPNFDPTKPKVIKLPTLTAEEKEKLLKKSELKNESSSKVMLKIDGTSGSPKIEFREKSDSEKDESKEVQESSKKMKLETEIEDKVKLETAKQVAKSVTKPSKVTTTTSANSTSTNVATKPSTPTATTPNVTKMIPVASPKTKTSRTSQVTPVTPVSQPTVQTVLTKLPIQAMKPVQTRLQPVQTKLTNKPGPKVQPGPQKVAVKSPVQLPIHPVHLPVSTKPSKTVQLTTSTGLTVSLASPIGASPLVSAASPVKIPQMAKVSIQPSSVAKTVTSAAPTVVTSVSGVTQTTRQVTHHVTQSKPRPIAAAKTQSQQQILPVMTSPVTATHVVNNVVNNVAQPTPLIIKNKVKPQVHISQNVQNHRADPLPLNEQKPAATERKKSVAEIVAESPSIVTMTPPPTPKTPPTQQHSSMTSSSPKPDTKFITPQSPVKVPIQPIAKTGSNQFGPKIKRTPTPPCSPGGQKTIEPKRTISKTTNHVTNTIRNNKIKIIDNNTIPVLPQGCQLLPIFQVVTASNQIAQPITAQPITISGSNSTSSIFTIPSTNIFTIQNTLKATDKLVPVTVPKTVQPKVEIKTIPKASPTPPPVSVTGSTATTEVTEKVTIKKEVPILEKPVVSGNDAKIELKIGVGKDGQIDQSPTTDRLIKLDKSPIIDHIRKTAAKNAKIDKISKLEKSEKIEKNHVIKVELEKSNENGQCDQQEEKVEEVKKIKDDVIRPRSNSKMAGLLLSPVANGGRKRKRCYTFSQIHAEEVSANNDPIPDSEGLEKILNLKEFLEKSTDPIFNEIPTPVIVNPVKDLVGCSTDFLTDCFPDNQFEVSLIDIPEMDPTSMIDTKKSLLLFNSNFPVPSGNPNNNNNNPDDETEDNEMEDEDFMKDAFIDLMEEDKAFIEQEFKESSSQKIKREFSLVEHEFKEEIKMEIETWGYSESSAGSSAASGDEEMIVSRKISIRSDIEEIDEDMIEDNEDDSEELKVLPLVAIEEGPDYVDFIKTSKSDPNHPKVKITKDLQMEWSQELAKVSKTKIYESDYKRFDSDPGYKTQSEMTEELNVDELETPPYTPPYPTDDELEWDMEREDEIRQELYESMELGPDSRRSMSPTSRRRLNNVAIEPFGLSPIIFEKRRKHSSQNLLNRALVLEGTEKENSNSIYFFCRDMCPNIRSVQKLSTNSFGDIKNGDKNCGATDSSSTDSAKSGKYLVVFNQSEDRNNFMKKCKTSKYNIQPFQNDHQRFISSS